jgi:hypothetical protein
MHCRRMPNTTIPVTREVAEKLRSEKQADEDMSDVIDRLLAEPPAGTVAEWLKSLEPLEGRGVFTPEERERLKREQRRPRMP